MKEIPRKRVRQILEASRNVRVLVVGDLMLDQFVWGNVRRISPEAPVPVVEFARESFMPGGAANVARNLTALEVPTELFGIVGHDDSARKLKQLLLEQQVICEGVLGDTTRPTSLKSRIIAHQQQMVRVDRESTAPLNPKTLRRLLKAVEERIYQCEAVIVGDYGKGVITRELLDALKKICRERGVWLSLDPKPINRLDLTGLSLITPNRKEAFELAGREDHARAANPLEDRTLIEVANQLLESLRPALLLITLGDQGMLLCGRGEKPFHIATIAQEVFDVSGAGDTVIASFTMAIAAGASPAEAAVISNHCAGVVVGKLGTATLTQEELLASFDL
ncbi:MAG TPA: D-glycero-beta-D-manno-heptose-7-phosphate kinase [Verrucomicrobiae bacterium]|jgi:D-beta-D-heptose 7-phosphate kinase/D-beta-D-heptose 1-phosphate adenosyltransferase|nr:D-glycero-beta-D-manno-heptose-7-phosphate kinase [Verrucomicrobiae bacterium]